MEFKNGAAVFERDGKEAGSLQRVVINPETNEVTHIVIHKGLIFVTDKVIPVEKVASTADGQIHLTCSIDEIDEMSPLEIEQTQPVREAMGNEREYDPMTGNVNANPLPGPNFSIMVRRTIPENLVAMKLGASATSRGDKQLGKIERVYTNSETGKVSHFVVSQGILVKDRKSLPFEWVSTISEEEVLFVIDSKQFDDLPANQD